MCGIVGGVAERNVTPILLEGLRRLEYRGYDSSGIAIIDESMNLRRIRSLGKIKKLQRKIELTDEVLISRLAIAHTRWATHGVPSEDNAHPHISRDTVAVVHNGIIENYQDLKMHQQEQGYSFESETDTEVVAHAIHSHLIVSTDILEAVKLTIPDLKGTYAFGVICKNDPNTLIAACKGSSLVIGVGIREYFIASDASALLPVTQRFIFLEDGDIAYITQERLTICNSQGNIVNRHIRKSGSSATADELGDHKHYMHKEVFDQPQAVIDTLDGRISQNYNVIVSSFSHQAERAFQSIHHIQIIACGTSFHAGLVAKYWFEGVINISCQVEVASEYRYRNPAIINNTLFLTISQSGETADTLAALQHIKSVRNIKDKKQFNIPTLSICNVAESSLTRESDHTCLTNAGPEIGVASTKSFTTQLVILALLMISIGRIKERLSRYQEQLIIQELQKLPRLINSTLEHEKIIKDTARLFTNKQHTLFLGRGTMYPIALEGALKLKEISYIHAEAYPAGELKHGPLALIDEEMTVIAIAPHDDLLVKLRSNIQEVKARGGQMIIFKDEQSNIGSDADFEVLQITKDAGHINAPIIFNIALQLLSYHVALIKGTDVDQPRSLAKSVTVE